DRDGTPVAVEDDENGETDRRLGGGHREHQQRVDLSDDVAQVGGERDQVDVDREQDQLDRHQDDDDVLAVEENTEDPEREQDRGNGQIMAKADGHVLLPSPCPDRTLTISIEVAGLRATCSPMSCRRTRGRWCSVSTMAPTIATSRIMPAAWKK